MKEGPESHPRPVSAAAFEELLSAYHDGELSPAEREAVERQLAASPEARQQLQQFRQVSGLLHELPQAELPREFSKQVLREAEREMLIPRLRGTAPVERRRQWLWISTGLSASAAALVGAVFLFRPAHDEGSRNSHREMDRTVAVLESDARRNHKFAGGSTTPSLPKVTSTHGGGGFQSKSTNGMVAQNENAAVSDSAAVTTAPMIKAEARPSELKTSVADTAAPGAPKDRNVSGDVAAAKAGEATSKKLAMARGVQQTESEKIANLKEIAPGKIVAAARQTPGGQAAVVRVVVIDQASMMKVVQVLDPVDFDTDGLPGVASSKTNGSSGEKAAAGSLQCVLVEADSEQLIAVVRDLLKQEPAIQSLQLEEPIAMAELSPPTNLAKEQKMLAATEKPRLPEGFSIRGRDKAPEPMRSVAPGRMSARGERSMSPTPPTSSAPSALNRDDKSDRKAEDENDSKQSTASGGKSRTAPAPAPAADQKMKLDSAAPMVADKKTPGSGHPLATRAPRGRARIVQMPAQAIQKRQIAKNQKPVQEPLDSPELLNSYRSKAVVQPGKSPQAPPEEVANGPAAQPASPYPVHVLFVLEPQPAAVPIDAPAKARLPGKAGGSRGTRSRFQRQG